ncbi:MAG: hypothetical protein AABW49_04420 [Nanoarchaeota archaeon]
MEQLTLREKEIFATLKKLRNHEFVVVGGYAVNAYTLPRFSVDCDVVIKDKSVLQGISRALFEVGYDKIKNHHGIPYDGGFERYEKNLGKNFKVSMDILIGEILDRQTNAKFSADWVFEHSAVRQLQGKTFSERLKLRIIDADALFVMKFIACRQTDIRDLFFLITLVKEKLWVKKEISERYDLKERLSKILHQINSKQFKDELQGVFGMVDGKIFERNKKLLSDLEKIK